ncbi:MULTISPECIES: hydroxymethylbilane synthase [Methanothermobacter]|uniref:Probable porphobilinogen deaminase n=2 Tax=Methanothermobacter thermautotrophicus TaxID=145262 RepID=HEM3_METTH|nr:MULTISPECIES: hydroxymethylbilane synthase [Methanothermobacter]O26960.1 RecName: Full=Probable porphobilinogen deaminase; Short=PBG; AltName: Full=Hydroxymethylbilane synthase; Short=HMBS; AltName: Full=Pre-uroporphyrinogen synthase [Methanothermobacter thermautotrophicus str. Delta H]MBC7111715.1 hydroxymethylbilane synthase [Methanothermobacter sp.]AAB85372.1 porphobilinogen deaminase [Methanothermobacter thermautotrophicus str. Delta H]WBF07090.1 hydroxymethylbilane synthase [Methanother
MIAGTRGSRLALVQTNHVIEMLSEVCKEKIEKKIIKTKGDRIRDSQLYSMDSRGLFTRELDMAVLNEEVDLAVHSLKDVPSDLDPDLAIAAVPPRESPAEVLVSRLDWEDLPQGSKLGTSSLRREAFCNHHQKNFKMEPLRGNIDTRIRKVMDGEVHATIMAEAGLKRLGLEEHIKRRFPVEYFTPAAGQGALAVITRADSELISSIGRITHHPSLQEVTAEKTLLRELGAGCQCPLGVIGRATGNQLTLYAVLLTREGEMLRKVTVRGPLAEAEDIGKKAAKEMEDYI